jgi:hypothetical protein
MQLVSIESSFSEHDFKIPKQAFFKFVEGGNNACCRLYFKKIQEKNDYNAVLAFETTTQLVRTHKFFDIFMFKKFKFNFIKIYREEINQIIFTDGDLEIKLILFNGNFNFKFKIVEEFEIIKTKFQDLINRKKISLFLFLFFSVVLFKVRVLKESKPFIIKELMSRN